MKNVQNGPPQMYTPHQLLEQAETKEECQSIVKTLSERSAEMIEFWIEMKGLRHEDPKADNVFVTANLDRLTLIDYGRSRRVAGLTTELKSKIEFDSVKGFNPLMAECNKKPSGGKAKEFPALIKPTGVSKISDKTKAKAAEEQDKRLEAQIRGAAGGAGGAGGGETSTQGAERNA
ncbi:hypothetical protein DFS33DRAFT_629242 [Desarmillaria ectypa]|nr:hypothetical protein DFS33DRAFT_629242 [Desarmillaria ectypa]